MKTPFCEPIFHVTLARSLPCILNEGLAPRIGPRSNIQGETVPQIYMFETRENMETALQQWLGDELDDQEIAIIKINPEGLDLTHDAGFELVCRTPISPASFLAVLDEEMNPAFAFCVPSAAEPTRPRF